MSKAKAAKKRAHWRDVPEWMVQAAGRTLAGITTAESLHPSENTMIGFIEGDPIARSIIGSWQFGATAAEVVNG